MVRITNNLAVPTKIIKVNLLEIGTLQPGEHVDISVDSDTVEIILKEVS